MNLFYMAYVESSLDRQSYVSSRKDEEITAQPEFTPQQAIDIFNAVTSQDPQKEADVLSRIQDEKLRIIAELALKGSVNSDEIVLSEDTLGEKTHVIVDFSNDYNAYFPSMEYQS